MISKKRFAYIFWIVLTVIPILGLIWSVLSPKDFEHWQDLSREWIVPLGVLGPVVFVLVQAAQVVITPISHYAVGAIGGYLYGPYFGGLLNYIGRVLGHCCAFMISRRLGRAFLVKHLDEATLRKYDRIVGGTTDGVESSGLPSMILFLIYFLPLFPDDEVSYIVGTSSLPRRSFLLANLFGHLGGAFSLAYLGSGVDTKDVLFWVLTGLTLVGFPAIWIALRISVKRQITKTNEANTK